MPIWPRYPSIYEINTWVWLSELSLNYRKPIDLASVPPAEWDALAALGFDAVWFMGVWERSPAGISISNANAQNLQDFHRAVPDFQLEDNVGSPYCVRRYVVDPHLGGPAALAVARQELAKRGLRLVLDFVPNHVATDHPWVTEHPEFFLQGTLEELQRDPISFTNVSGKILACGRDPYFPAWQDVLQLNIFHPSLRRAAIETVSQIAAQCDGVRCDMAMLLLNSIFERTWGARAGTPPPTEYWKELIPTVKAFNHGFLFIAEAYWDLEWQLQQLGFDFCYDKRLYDRLEHANADTVRQHLSADLVYQSKLLRFLENHDEPRAASAFPPEKEKAAAVVSASLPGARLFHEGQLDGRKVRLPVFLRRRPNEPADPALQQFYRTLLQAIDHPLFREGRWALCRLDGWPDNSSYQNLVAWTWQDATESFLIVVNLRDQPSQGRVFTDWTNALPGKFLLTDSLSGDQFERDSEDLRSAGLYVGLPAWGFHFLQLRNSRT